MRSVKAPLFIAFIILMTLSLSLNQSDSAEKILIKSTDWNIKITSFEEGVSKIPVIGGLASISAKGDEEGVVIKAEIQPTPNNTRLVIDLKDFKLKVGEEEFTPFTADITVKGKNSIESVQGPGGYSSKLKKGDFPAGISIMYMVTKHPKKILLISGSEPVLLSNPK
jgi:hypothetical protein